MKKKIDTNIDYKTEIVLQSDPDARNEFFQSQELENLQSIPQFISEHKLVAYPTTVNQNQSKKLKYPQDYSYTFPIQLLIQKKISGKDQFKKLMKQQAKDTTFDTYWKIDRKPNINNNQFRIYVQCLKCKANIRYHQNKDKTWTLLTYKNTHIHLLENKKAYKLLTQAAIYQNLYLPNSKLHKAINRSYPMDRNTLLRKKRELIKNSNFDLIQQLFKFLDYDSRYQDIQNNLSKQGYPETLIAVSPLHKQNYRKYGQILNYEISNNCIKQTTSLGKRYIIGLFSGFDNNNRIIIFGISINTYQRVQTFKNIFSSFFEMMQLNITTSIITYQHQNLTQALRQLKKQKQFSYHHIYDQSFFLRTFKTSLYNLFKPQNIQYYTNQMTEVIQQSDPIIGKSSFQKLKQQMIEYGYNLSKFQEKISYFCVWSMPKQFLGVTLYSTASVNDILKLKVQYEITLYQLIQKLEKVTQQINKKRENHSSYQLYKFEKLFDDPRIQQVKFKFQKNIFRLFIQNYRKSEFYQISNENNYSFQIQHIFNRNKFTIIHLDCSCSYTIKTGIPCEHIIYIYKNKYQNESYTDLFNARWIGGQKVEKIINLKGRRKKTRRNRIRL